MIKIPDKTSIEKLKENLMRKHRVFQISRQSMGLIITNNCPVGCRHCISDNKYNLGKEIPLSKLKLRVDKIVAFNSFKIVTLTGGEPFYVFEKLCKLIDYITKKKMKTSVVTSAYWASSQEKTRSKIQKLYDAGIYAMAISVDQYHLEKIPVSNIANAINICNEFGIIHSLAVTNSNNKKADDQLIKSIKKILPSDVAKSLKVSNGSMLNSGRAENNKLCENVDHLNKKDSSLLCHSIGKIILQNGQLALCCAADLPKNSPLLVGSIDQEPVAELQKRIQNNYLIPFIEVLGLKEMFKMLKKRGGDIEFNKNDLHEANICKTCNKLLSNDKYRNYFQEKIKDPEIEKLIAGRYLLYYGHSYLIKKHAMEGV